MDDHHTLDLCRHLLAVLTGRLEDAAAAATAGQGARSVAEAYEVAVALQCELERSASVAQAVVAISG